MTIYVIRGTTGEYSDRTEWAVKAFKDKTKTLKCIIELEREAKRIQFERGSEYRLPDDYNNPLDPKMIMDYTGTSYFYDEVELDDHGNGD